MQPKQSKPGELAFDLLRKLGPLPDRASSPYLDVHAGGGQFPDWGGWTRPFSENGAVGAVFVWSTLVAVP